MRSLGQTHLLAVTFLLLAASSAFADGLRVLRSDSEALEIEWTLEQPVLESLAGEDGVYRRPEVPGALWLAEAGFPDVPSIVKLLGVPVDGTPEIQILSVSTSSVRLPDMAPAPAQVGIPGETEDDPPTLLDVRTRSVPFPRQLSPSRWAELVGTLSMRGQRMTRLVIHPCRYDGASEELVWAKRLVVRISFGEDGRGMMGRRAPESGEWERTMDATLLNADVARRWRAPRGLRARGGGGDSFESSPNWIRIPIERNGAYWVDYFTFSNLGFDPAGIDPTTIRVFNGTNRQLREDYDVLPPDFMAECALLDVGNQDAIFDLEDRLLFYGLTPNGWASEYDAADSTVTRADHVENQYTDTSYYWVTWGGSFQNPPKRMATRSVSPGAGPFAESAPWREHFEQNNLDNFRHRDEDGFFWEILLGRGDNRNYFLSIDDVASGDGIVTAVVASDGKTDEDSLRIVELKVQNTIVADTTWIHAPNYFPPTGPNPVPRGARFHIVGDSLLTAGRLVEGVNRITLNVPNDTEGSSDRVLTAWFDIEYDRELKATTGARCKMFSDPDYGVSDYLISGFDSDTVYLLDVTDQHDIVQLNYGALDTTIPDPNGVRFSDPGQPGVRWYYAVSTEGVAMAPPGESVFPAGLRSPANRAAFVVIHHPLFRSGAERLAALRRTAPGAELTALVVDVTEVYNEFGWGMVDPMAIRDFLAYALENWHTPPLFVVFLGDAAYDTKGWLAGSPDNQISAFANAYRREATSQYDADLNLHFYSTDDFYGYLELTDFNGPPGTQPVLDIAIGRYPASTTQELDVMLDKLDSYLARSSPGQWLNRMILVADDEVTPTANDETIHTIQVEELAESWYPPALDKVKVYLTEFPFNDFDKKPESQAMFLEEFTRGALIVTYSGHGDQNQLAQEEVFVAQKTPELLNEDRYPVFTTFSCTVSRFDLLSGNSMTENMLFHEGGGIVESFSSGGLVFPVTSHQLNKAFLSDMFGTPYPVDTFARSLRPLGLAVMTAKALVGSNAPTRRNNEKYNLLGDPALEPRFGRHVVVFDSTTVNTSPTEGFARVVRGQVLDEHGTPLDGTGGTMPFDGTAFVHVTENADTSGYIAPADGERVRYTLEGHTVFRGEVPVTAGQFEAKFVTSETVMTGNLGRVSVYVLEDGSSRGATPRDGSGAYDRLFLTPTISSQADDAEGPEVRIAFEGYERFVDGDYLFTGKPVLLISLADTSGVNLRPFPQFARLEAEIDGRERIDLSSDFSYESGSFTRGKVRRIFPLAEGDHTIKVKAFDNVGNRGSDEVRFRVILDSGQFALDQSTVTFYPNPFRDETDLLFSLTHPAEVSLKVFTINGRRVYQAPSTLTMAGNENAIHWDGRDDNGNPLANGTYLYKLEATYTNPEGNRESGEFVGKVVKMR